MYDNIKKSLDSIENPLIRQTAAYMISNIENAVDDENADIAKSALLLYLNATAPNVLKSNIAVEQALHKSFDEIDQSDVEYEKKLKKILADNGIYYFGSLYKHNTKFGRPGDPRAPGDKRFPHAARAPHLEQGGYPKLPTQRPHGIRPGRREMISHLRDLQQLTGLEIGSRNELLSWNHSQLQQYLDRVAPGFLENFVHGTGRRNRAAAGYGEQNTLQADRLKMWANYLNSPQAPSHIGRMSRGTAAQRVSSLRNIPESTRSGRLPAGRGGRATIEPRAASDAEMAQAEGATDKIPELLNSMNQVPRDNIMWQNFERLKSKIQRNIQEALSEKPRSAAFMNRVLNEAVKNPANLRRERSTGNQDMPRWMSEEAAGNPDVQISRDQQEEYARTFGYDLPPTAEQQAELDEAGARAAEEKKKRTTLQTRAGGKGVSQGDVRSAIREANSKLPENDGEAYDLASLLTEDIKNIRNIAAGIRARGVDKDEALRIMGGLAVNLNTLLAEKGGGVKLNQKERQAAQSSVNKLLNRLRSLDVEELADYFSEKLNVGETIHATFANAPVPKKPRAAKKVKKSDDGLAKFNNRLEKYRSRSAS